MIHISVRTLLEQGSANYTILHSPCAKDDLYNFKRIVCDPQIPFQGKLFGPCSVITHKIANWLLRQLMTREVVCSKFIY